MLCDYFYFLLFIDEALYYKVLCTFNFQLKRENIFIYLLFEVIILTFIIFFIFFLLRFKSLMEMERVSSYECGFDINSKTRNSFSYRFFLISILFLIFDVEIALILPVPYFCIGVGSFFFLLFLVVLVVGLLFEYFTGILRWL